MFFYIDFSFHCASWLWRKIGMLNGLITQTAHCVTVRSENWELILHAIPSLSSISHALGGLKQAAPPSDSLNMLMWPCFYFKTITKTAHSHRIHIIPAPLMMSWQHTFSTCILPLVTSISNLFQLLLWWLIGSKWFIDWCIFTVFFKKNTFFTVIELNHKGPNERHRWLNVCLRNSSSVYWGLHLMKSPVIQSSNSTQAKIQSSPLGII